MANRFMYQKQGPWHKLDGEPDTAYFAFTLYRDLGKGRTLSEAYARSGLARGQRTDVPRQWSKWHSEWAWDYRCDAYDARGGWKFHGSLRKGRGLLS